MDQHGKPKKEVRKYSVKNLHPIGISPAVVLISSCKSVKAIKDDKH